MQPQTGGGALSIAELERGAVAYPFAMALLGACFLGACASDAPPQMVYGTPFDAVRAEECQGLVVRVDGRWHALAAVDGVPMSRLEGAARVADPDGWRSWFGAPLRGLVQRAGGSQVGEVFRLRLQDAETDVEYELERVATLGPLAEVDRSLEAAASSMSACGWPEVERPRSGFVPRQLEALVRTGYFEDPRDQGDWRSEWLEGARARADLRQLEWIVRNHFAYADADAVDDEIVLDAIEAALPETIRVGDFALQLQKYLASSIDGHAPRVSGLAADGSWERIENRLPGERIFPFLMRSTGSRVVAFDAGTRSLVDAAHPYVAEIDGWPVRTWIAAAQSIITGGSPQLRFRRGVGLLADLNFLRAELGRPRSGTAVVTLSDEAGESRIRRTVGPVRELPDTAGRLPLEADARARVPVDIAYVRIRRMEGDEAYNAGLAAWVEASRDARGAIIDIRDNGGGSRLPLLTLLPHVLARGETPVVVNAGRLKVGPYCPDCPEPAGGYLENRYMRTLGGWPSGSPERRALEGWLRSFTPTWSPPDEGFSAWHYLVIGPASDPVFEGKPVVILQNDGNFSASDIFLSGFKGLDHVTLVGVPSSGGSARGQGYVLPNSGLRVNLATLASFQARNSMLYDGVGIEPDVLMEPEPGFFLGESDAVLEYSIDLVRRETSGR